MKRLLKTWLRVGKATHLLAGMILALMFLLTLAEVLLRFLWNPIPGSYELISMLGGLVIGLSIPYTSQRQGHVNVDFMVNKCAEMVQLLVSGVTRTLALIFFALVGWSLVVMGMDLRVTKEVSQQLRLPLYPVAFGLGLAFLIQAVQFLLDIAKIWRGQHE